MGTLTLHLYFPHVATRKDNKHTTSIKNVALPLMGWSNRTASNIIWNLFSSFKFPSVFAGIINLTVKHISPEAFLDCRQVGKEKPVAKSRAGTSHGEFMPSRRLHHLPASALLPRWRSLIYLCRYQNQLQIPWGCPKWCFAARGCFLPSSQATPHRKRLWGMWGRECGVLRARLYLFFRFSSCCQHTDLFCVWDCNLSLPQRCCQLYKYFQKLNNSRKIHIMQTSLFPDDTTWSTKHEQKRTKENTEALWKKLI